MEEYSIVKKELNIFQKIRKALFVRGMNTKKAHKYPSLPEYLQFDDDVIEAVLNVDSGEIEFVPFEKQKEFLKQRPELITEMYEFKTVQKHIENNPNLVESLEKGNKTNFIFRMLYSFDGPNDKSFIQFLSSEMQMKLLTETQKYRDLDYNDKIVERSGSPMAFYKYINCFSEDAILKFGIKEKKDLEERHAKGSLFPGKNKLLDYDLKSLPIATQIKLILISDDFIKNVSEEAVLMYANNNPILFEKIPTDIKTKLVNDNLTLLSKMPLKFQRQYIENNPQAFMYAKFSPLVPFKIENFSSPEKAIQALSVMRLNRWRQDGVEDIASLKSEEFAWRMGKYNPKSIEISSFINDDNMFRNVKLANYFHKVAQKQDPNSELTQFLSRYQNGNISELSYEDNKKLVNRIAKIIVNDDILEKVNGTSILEYAQNPTHDKLVEIISATYGEKAAQILRDRPQIELDHINNLYIFKPEIIEEFGIGAVHANLTFDMSTSGILAEFAQNSDLLSQYRKFNNVTREFFPDTAIGLEEKLISFMDCLDLVKETNFENLTEIQKQNLFTMIIDRSDAENPIIVDMPKTLEELEMYISKRNAMYDEAIKKESNPEAIKQYMSKRFFGLDYLKDPHHVNLNPTSVYSMCNFYHLDNFVNDSITLNSGKFSEEELDILELLEVFRSVKSPEVLQQLAAKMAEYDCITPTNIRELKTKVPEQYTQEMVDAIITPEKAKDMVEQGIEGIRAQEEDGITIYFLEGVDFKAYITNPFMDNSNIGRIGPHELAKQWKEKEDGISTISGCVIDQHETKSCVGRNDMGLGFGKINPNQIIGMGNTDIHLAHNKRYLNTSSTEGLAVSYDYPEELMRKTERRVEDIEDPYNDPNHKYNEMGILRTEETLSEIQEGTYGGKIIPDYIYFNGTSYNSAKNMALQMGIKTLFVFDEEKYKYKGHQRAYAAKKENTPRPETSFMQDIKKVVKGEVEDER